MAYSALIGGSTNRDLSVVYYRLFIWHYYERPLIAQSFKVPNYSSVNDKKLANEISGLNAVFLHLYGVRGVA